MVLGVPIIWVSTRRYLRLAPDGYLRERATYAVAQRGRHRDGRRRPHGRRPRARGRGVASGSTRRLARAAIEAERYTLRLRLIWFPPVEFAYLLPVAGALLWGGWLVSTGHAASARSPPSSLYVQQMVDPLDELLSWLDEIQVGATSLARVIGVGRRAAGPGGDRRDARRRATSRSSDVRYAYRAGRDVLRGVSLDLAPR